MIVYIPMLNTCYWEGEMSRVRGQMLMGGGSTKSAKNGIWKAGFCIINAKKINSRFMKCTTILVCINATFQLFCCNVFWMIYILSSEKISLDSIFSMP